VKKIAVAFAFSIALLGVALAGESTDKLPEIGPAPDFSLMSQDGKPVTLIGLNGKVVAVTFLYTACPDICPLLTQKMVEVQDALGEDFGGKIHFVSITLDPERDTQEVLKDYATAWEAKLDGWSFLTGPAAAVTEVAHRYGIYAAKTPEGFIDHTLLTSIIDRRGMLRVQYMGSRFDPAEFRRDLQRLVAEK
jgi:protein SCO1/2